MTTTAHPSVLEELLEKLQKGERPTECPECPRCQNPDGPWCSGGHEETPGEHPLCKVCGHCALRGGHLDPAEDVRSGKYRNRRNFLN